MASRYQDQANEADWGDEDPEAPQERDREADEDSECVPCPHCGRPVYEDADRCPHCGEFVLPGRTAGPRRRWWPVAAVVVIVLAAAWLLGPCPG